MFKVVAVALKKTLDKKRELVGTWISMDWTICYYQSSWSIYRFQGIDNTFGIINRVNYTHLKCCLEPTEDKDSKDNRKIVETVHTVSIN